jgi:hypothetical protein
MPRRPRGPSRARRHVQWPTGAAVWYDPQRLTDGEDAGGEVWVERGGQLTTLNPHRKVRFDAMRLTLNDVVVGLASSDEQERASTVA